MVGGGSEVKNQVRVAALIAGLLFFIFPAATETLTVCSSGCTHQTINAAIRAASCGDKIQLSASETHYGGDGNQTLNNPIVLKYKSCASGTPIVITTDQGDRLPAPDTRITPNYADGQSRVVPLIVNPAYGPILTTDVGPQPAHDYKLVGLEFCCAAWRFSDFISIGETGNGSNEPLLNTISDLPYNIDLDRILVRTDPLGNMRKCITFDGVNVTIRNSWIDCAFDRTTSDSQAITGFNPQHLKVLNNYISGTTETVNFSGACSPIRTPKFLGYCTSSLTGAMPFDIELAFNDITKPSWMRTANWTANTRVPKGKSMLPASGAVIWMQARNAGVTGTTQPQWPSAMGSTVNDGSVVWEVMDGGPGGKNLLECKACDTLNIHHNFFHEVWPQGQQGYALTFTSRTNPGAGGGNWAHIKDVTIENNVITNAGSGINASASDADADPNTYASMMPTNAPPYNIGATTNRLLIRINGGTPQAVTLTQGTARTAQDILNDLNAQLKSGIACLQDDRFMVRASNDGPGSCGGYVATTATIALASALRFEPTSNDAYGVLGFTSGVTYGACVNPRTGLWYGCGDFSGLFVRNNLWTNINVAPNLAGIPYIFSLLNKIRNVEFSHNTVDAADPGSMFFLAAETMPNSGVKIVNNILGVRSTPTAGEVSHPFNGYGTLTDFSAINYLLCNVVVTDKTPPIDSVCPPGVVVGNIMPGIRVGSTATRDTRPASSNSGYGYYPSGNWGDSWASLKFANPTEFDFALKGSASGGRNKFASAALDGRDVGVDSSQLPLITNFNVSATDQQASISFQLSEPIRPIPCVIRVSTDPDFATVIPDLDPSQFLQPDSSNNPANISDGALRIMMIGLNAPLDPETLYHYHLACGGASRSGTFTTANTPREARMITISRVPQRARVSDVVVEWGYKYNRASGIVNSTQTVTNCNQGSSCKVQIAPNRGKAVFYRVLYRDSSGAVVYSEPVRTIMAL
jgi:hypothetical protein